MKRNPIYIVRAWPEGSYEDDGELLHVYKAPPHETIFLDVWEQARSILWDDKEGQPELTAILDLLRTWGWEIEVIDMPPDIPVYDVEF